MSRYIGLEFDPYRPWNQGILRGVEAFAANHPDWRLLPHRLIASHRVGLWGTREKADGMITDQPPSWATGLGIPIICFNKSFNRNPFPIVCSNFRAIGELAAGHLAQKGYSAFACFEQFANPTLAEGLRNEGFRARASELSVDVINLSLPEAESSMVHYFKIDSLTPYLYQLSALPKPSGIFARNLAEAYILHFLIAEAGLHMPDEIGLIVGGNDQSQLEALRPSVTGISRNTYGLGYRAAQQLQCLFEGQPVEALTELPPGGVIERESTGLEEIGDAVVAQARNLMKQRIGTNFSLDDLARELGVSSRSLRRRFRATVHHSPMEEMQQIRLDLARNLLETSLASVSEVSERCGFAEPAQLSRLIKAATGLTPTQFRSHSLRAQQ